MHGRAKPKRPMKKAVNGRPWLIATTKEKPASLSRLPPVWQRERRINIHPVQSGGLSILTAGNR